MLVRKAAILAFLFTILTAISVAQKTLVNINAHGAALEGHDPVAFFTAGKPVKGDAKIQSIYRGARYYFVNAENKKAFDAEPAKYEPQFGGYCAYGMSRGYTAPVEIDAFQVVNGRLLMQYDKGVRDTFNKDTQGNLKKADANWPKVLEKEGK
jgi:YHS domain-containing protein